MSISVNKFLALTAALATSAVLTNCIAEDDTPGEGGETGGVATGGASDAGATSTGGANGGATNGGATNGGATNGGATNGGATNGGATNGGATTAGAPTSGGAGGEGGGVAATCLGDDPAFELDCTVVDQTDCTVSDPTWEEYYPNYEISTCMLAGSLRTGLQASIVACLQGLTEDPCTAEGAAAAAACRTAALGQACETTWAADSCSVGYTDGLGTTAAAVLTACDDGTLTEQACVSTLSVVTDPWILADCMDPAGEFYEPLFTGDCAERLDACVSTNL